MLGPRHALDGQRPVMAVLGGFRHQDAEREKLGEAEVLGENIGPVVDLVDDPADSLFRRLGYAPPLVYDAVHGSDRNPGSLGDFFNGGNRSLLRCVNVCYDNL